MSPLLDLLRDDIEQELLLLRPAEAHTKAAGDWRRRFIQDHPHVDLSVSQADAVRWPMLSLWAWFVPNTPRETTLSVDINGSSTASTAKETGVDLAYRGVLPLQLGAMLCHLTVPQLEALVAQEVELHASIRQPVALQHELKLLSRAHAKALPAIKLSQALLLGLRHVRAAYQQRLDVWIRVARVALPAQLASDPAEAPADRAAAEQRPPPADAALRSWLNSEAGQRLTRELRWQLPRPAVAISRLRSSVACGRLLEASIANLLQQQGVPLVTAGAPAWSNTMPTWQECLVALRTPCQCQQVAGVLTCCWACGGAAFPLPADAPLPCPWCRQARTPACAACHRTLHFRGSCRWNMGASHMYDVADTGALICPDCWWLWAQSLASCPRRRQVQPIAEDLRQHLRAVAAQAQPSAGSGVVRAESLPLRKVRRWLLTHLRRSNGSSMSALRARLRDLAPGVAEDWRNDVLLRAGRALCREGLAAQDGEILTPLPT